MIEHSEKTGGGDCSAGGAGAKAARGIERGWLIGATALVVYAAFASSHIVDGDNAEFATLGAIGGGAHPSGYPLYVLWLRAWSWLPGTPAHSAALATAILGALTVGVLHAACRAWGARPLAATITVAIAGAAPIVLRYHCEAEVFAMNNLACALVLWLAADAGPLRGHRRAAALGLVAGLGLANHLTCALLAPIGLYGVVRAARESRSAATRESGAVAARESDAATRESGAAATRESGAVATACVLAIAGLVVGLLPYVYLFIADGPASWGRVTTLSQLLATIRRDEYGGTTSFIPGGELPWPASIAACLSTIARSWLWPGAVAGVVMLGVRIWRPLGASRWAWALLAASFVLAGPVLASRFNVDPHGIGLYVCQRFHILPTLLLAVPVAAAVDLACVRFERARAAAASTASSQPGGDLHGSATTASSLTDPGARDVTTPRGKDPDLGADADDAAGARSANPMPPHDHAGHPPTADRAVGGNVLAVLGFVALSIIALPALLRVHSPAMELGVRNLLRTLPRDAIAVVVSEDQCFGGRYLQLALDERPDVALVCSELLRRDWYRAAWTHRGLAMPSTPGTLLGDTLLRAGRPIFVDPRTATVLSAFPSYPFGVAYRVLPRGSAPLPASEIAVINRDLYHDFDLDYARPSRDDDFAAVAHRRYAGAWAAISNLLDAAGDHAAALDAYEVGRSLQPLQDSH